MFIQLRFKKEGNEQKYQDSVANQKQTNEKPTLSWNGQIIHTGVIKIWLF